MHTAHQVINLKEQTCDTNAPLFNQRQPSPFPKSSLTRLTNTCQQWPTADGDSSQPAIEVQTSFTCSGRNPDPRWVAPTPTPLVRTPKRHSVCQSVHASLQTRGYGTVTAGQARLGVL